MTFHNWAERLLAFKRGATYDYTRSKLQHLERAFGVMSVDAIGPDAVDWYVSKRRYAGVRDTTIGKEFGVLLQVLRLAKRGGDYHGDLTVLRPLDLRNDSQPGTRALTAQEVRKLLLACPQPLRTIVAFIVATGARRSEALRAQPEDITTDTVRIRGTKTRRADAVVPVLEPYRGLLQSDVALPVRYRGNLSRDLHLACSRAGIAPCCPNDLRRTHITILREAGIDAESARSLLRHSPASRLLERVYDQSRPEVVAKRVAGALSGVKV